MPLSFPSLLFSKSYNDESFSGRNALFLNRCARVDRCGFGLFGPKWTVHKVNQDGGWCEEEECASIWKAHRLLRDSSGYDCGKCDAAVFKEFENIEVEGFTEIKYAKIFYSDDEPDSFIARKYGHPMSTWKVGKVTNFKSLFSLDSDVPDITPWDMSNAVDLSDMFYFSRSFNQNISAWNVSKVTNMDSMFEIASSFNQDLSAWNTGNVENMGDMFSFTDVFNGNIGNWDVSKVADFSMMFASSGSFNEDISGWEVGSGTTFEKMFSSATGFNQDLCDWGDKMSGTPNVGNMFDGASVCESQDSPDFADTPKGPFCSICIP